MAIELAARFSGEIVNVDAMQLYEGLDIVTNKVSIAEQRGVPHHLLGHIPVHHPSWDVEAYKLQASKTIAEIRSRGNLPVLVGGTNYYIEPLLFENVTLDHQSNSSQIFPILDAPTEEIHDELRRVDPIMAERWHPNDRRKIQRSLEIFLQTGQRASDLYASQKERKAELVADDPWEALLFWVYAERETHCERLDRRVDKMLEGGLLDEVQDMYNIKQESLKQGQDLDMTKGVWQSIGYRQFEPYVASLAAGVTDSAKLDALKAQGLADMQTATRRYAKYQNRWIRTKLMGLLRERGLEAVNSLYLLDSSDISHYSTNVIGPAADLTAQLLSGGARREPSQLSDLAKRVLSQATEAAPPEDVSRHVCEVCETTHLWDSAWKKHVGSKGHKMALKRKKRLALVPVQSFDMVTPEDGAQESSGCIDAQRDGDR